MFQVASLLGVCNILNVEPAINDRSTFINLRNFCPNLNNQMANNVIKTIPDTLPISVKRNERLSLSDLTMRLDNTKLDSYLQNEELFTDVKASICELFTPASEYLDEAYKIKNNTKYKFALHIRGTDYQNVGLLIAKNTYIDVLEFAKTIVDPKEILIITDDIPLVKSWFDTYQYNIQSNSEHVDFCLIYLADYCYVLNSTFSYWARYISHSSETFYSENCNPYNSKAFNKINIKILFNNKDVL
jgi:hypothetical protein